MESKYKSLAVVIPIYNEEKLVRNTVSRVIAEISKLKNPSFLLFVNDGSHDQTLKIVVKLQKKYKNKLIIVSHEKNLGYGAATQTGINYALKNNIDYILFMDSDLTNNPLDIKRFAKEMELSIDCVKGSRYIKGGKAIGVPKIKVLISRLGNFIASSLFNIKINDCTNGFRMVKVSRFKNEKLSEKGFPIIMEELYILKKKHSKIKEIPVTLTSRKLGKSHFNYSLKTFFNYLKYPIKSIWV